MTKGVHCLEPIQISFKDSEYGYIKYKPRIYGYIKYKPPFEITPLCQMQFAMECPNIIVCMFNELFIF